MFLLVDLKPQSFFSRVFLLGLVWVGHSGWDEVLDEVLDLLSR